MKKIAFLGLIFSGILYSVKDNKGTYTPTPLDAKIDYFLKDQEIALNDRQRKDRYIRYLRLLSSDTSYFNYKQGAYLQEQLPGFLKVVKIFQAA